MVEHLTAAERRWQGDRELLAQAAPGLTLQTGKRHVPAKIEGVIQVPRPAGRSAEFDVSIRYPGTDPFEVPACYDPANRFPPDPDRHVESDGKFCLWLPWLEPTRDFQGPDGLALFLLRLQEFLVLQLQYETRKRFDIHPFWPGQQWGHGLAGYQEWFSETTHDLGADRLASLLTAINLSGNAGRRCPCGSGKRLSNCHKPWLRQLSRAWWTTPGAREESYKLMEERRATP